MSTAIGRGWLGHVVAQQPTATSRRGTLPSGAPLIVIGVVFVVIGLGSYAMVKAMSPGDFGIPSATVRDWKLAASATFVAIGVLMVIDGVVTLF